MPRSPQPICPASRMRCISPPASVGAVSPTPSGPVPAAPVAAEPAAPVAAAENGLIDLDSPIVGTFFSASSPDAPPFVQVGSRVQKGQVVCIVEAMKVMNEIEAEFDGEVVEVIVSNGQPVEYGETLFRLRPSS